jgi:hypothetical protein
MTKQLTTLDYLGGVDRFSTLFIRVNELVAALNTEIITANNLANGAVSTGNAYVNGIFAGLTFAVSTLRGGNVQSSGNLAITTNVNFSGAKLALGGSTTLTLGSLQANSTELITPKVTVGNATVNVVLTANTITLGGTTFSNLSPTITVANNGTNIGTRGKLNFKPSNSVEITFVDNANTDSIDVTVMNTLIPSAVGNDTEVQFNDEGVFGSSNGFLFAKTTNTLSVANNIILSKIEFADTNNRIISNTVTINSTSSMIVDSFPITDFRTVEYTISFKDNNANNYQCQKMLVIHDDGAMFYTSYAKLCTNTDIVSFDVSSNSTYVSVNCTSTSNSGVLKLTKNMLAV